VLSFALFSATFVAGAPAFAAGSSAYGDEDDILSYDNIVRDLQQQAEAPRAASSSRTRVRGSSYSSDPFENVLIHAGIGMSAIVESVTLPDNNVTYLNQKGIQAALGIDLFSPNWMAEGTARSFGESEDAVNRVSLKEFELKVFYKRRFSSQLGLRAGGGLSGRYMTIRQADTIIDTTTPSSVATIGFDFFLSEGLSLGVEVSGRQAMIGETLDRASADGTVRIDTHF
jgi:hypothetical protein